jgi:hypothetical protein
LLTGAEPSSIISIYKSSKRDSTAISTSIYFASLQYSNLHINTMTYKSNYEPYVGSPTTSVPTPLSDRAPTSHSFDPNELRPSIELLYPLGDLYPHVVALQLQSEEENPWSASKNFTGYQDTAYWAEVVSSPRSLPENFSKRSFRRCSGKFISNPRSPARPVPCDMFLA